MKRYAYRNTDLLGVRQLHFIRFIQRTNENSLFSQIFSLCWRQCHYKPHNCDGPVFTWESRPASKMSVNLGPWYGCRLFNIHSNVLSCETGNSVVHCVMRKQSNYLMFIGYISNSIKRLRYDLFKHIKRKFDILVTLAFI
jgi:hypothetical protein